MAIAALTGVSKQAAAYARPTAGDAHTTYQYDAIGRMLEAQHTVHELGLRLEQGLRMHRRDYPSCRGAPISASTQASSTPP